MDAYDVMIIGSGAGGGTLAHRLAPSGKRILLLERGGYLPRERDNWDRGGVPQGQVPTPARSGSTRRRGVHARAELLRRRQHEVLRRRAVPPAARGLRRDPPPRWHLARLAARATRTSSPTTPRPSGCTCVHGERGRGPDRGARASGDVPLPGGPARAAHPAAQRRPRAARACTPPTCRSASMLDQDGERRGEPGEPLHPLRPRRRLPVPRGRQGRRPGRVRRSGARPPQRRPRHQRLGRAARDRRHRAPGHRRGGDARRRVRGHVLRRHRGGRPAAR